LNFFAVNA
jgi:hypothetical protein